MAEAEHQFVTIFQFAMKQIGNKGKIQLSLEFMVSQIEIYSLLDKYLYGKKIFFL